MSISITPLLFSCGIILVTATIRITTIKDLRKKRLAWIIFSSPFIITMFLFFYITQGPKNKGFSEL